MLGKGHVVLCASAFLVAKPAGVGVTAFVFDVCHARLMTLPLFARLYARVVAFRDWAHQRVEPYRQSLRASIQRLRMLLSARLTRGAPSLMHRLAAFRARIRTQSRTSL